MLVSDMSNRIKEEVRGPKHTMESGTLKSVWKLGEAKVMALAGSWWCSSSSSTPKPCSTCHGHMSLMNRITPRHCKCFHRTHSCQAQSRLLMPD